MASHSEDVATTRPWRDILLKEIAISFLVNVVFNMTFAILLFDTGQRIALWGHAGIAADLLPATFMPALMMTFGITLGIKRRVRLGVLAPDQYVVPNIPLPRPLGLRALAIAILAVTIIVPPTLGLIALSWTAPWTWHQFVAFKLGFSAVHAALVTPIVVISALRCGR